MRESIARGCGCMIFMALIGVLLLVCHGCSESSRGIDIPADQRFDCRKHVSDPESEAKIKGVTNDSGPTKWFDEF